MSAFDGVDLNALPPPEVVETLDFEAIVADLIAELQAQLPGFDALVESDPAIKLVEVQAYLAMLLRQRVNDAAKSVMLAYATGADLEHLAALFDVGRQIVIPADPQAAPPIAEVLESDASLRRRAQLALEGATAAGTRGRYTFHALSADAKVADVSITSPIPGDVVVTVLSIDGNGGPDQAILDNVAAKLMDEDIRQLNDTVIVQGASIQPVTIDATLVFLPGAASQPAFDQANANLQALINAPSRLGRDFSRSAIFAALHVEGVSRVTIASPAADVSIDQTQAAHVTSVTLTDGGVDG